MSKLVPVKVSRFQKERSEKHLDPDGKYPYMSDLMTDALTRLNDKLDKELESQ